MRILYVVHQFYPKYVSGTEQYVLGLARAGRARGDDVRVFALDPDFRAPEPSPELRTYEWLGVPVTLYRFDKSAIRNHALQDFDAPEVGGPFREILDEFRPDLVHFFHLRWLGVDRFRDVVARDVPFVVHLMDFWFVCPVFVLLRPGGELCDGPPDGGLGCLECVAPELERELRERGGWDLMRRRASSGEVPPHEPGGEATALALARRLPTLVAALQRANRVFAPSATVRDLLLANGHRPARLELAPYAVDWDLVGDVPDAPSGPITFGFAGTLAPHKGVDVLLRAFRAVEDPELRLEVHGRFGDYPAYDDELRELAGADPRITFAGGFERERLPEILGRLHALVVPSRWRENTPFVCLEGRAAGLPVIASDLSGLVEAVPAGRGRLFRANSAPELARSLEAVASELRGRGGARLAQDRSIPTTAVQYEAFRRVYADP